MSEAGLSEDARQDLLLDFTLERPMRDLSPVEALTVASDWLNFYQHIYHTMSQRFPNETTSTCEAGMCGDLRRMRDLLRKSQP